MERGIAMEDKVMSIIVSSEMVHTQNARGSAENFIELAEASVN